MMSDVREIDRCRVSANTKRMMKKELTHTAKTQWLLDRKPDNYVTHEQPPFWYGRAACGRVEGMVS